MKHKLTNEELTNELQERYDKNHQELCKLLAIIVNESHKTLTNRAITGATLTNKGYTYGKELHYGEQITINCNDGERVITPKELNERINERIDYINSNIATIQQELDNVETTVTRHNNIIDLVQEHNNLLAYSSTQAYINMNN